MNSGRGEGLVEVTAHGVHSYGYGYCRDKIDEARSKKRVNAPKPPQREDLCRRSRFCQRLVSSLAGAIACQATPQGLIRERKRESRT